MGDTLKKIDIKKIKEFLFKNKKRKVITICSFVLAIVILLSAILIPAISNMNKRFKTEEEMRAYLFGIWQIDGSYYIFDNDYVYAPSIQTAFYEYIVDKLKSTSDIDLIKIMYLADCAEDVKAQLEIEDDVVYSPKKGKITINKGNYLDIEISIKKDKVSAIILGEGDKREEEEEIIATKVSDDTSLSNPEFAEIFNTVKREIHSSDFIPSFSDFKEEVKNNAKTSSLVNTNSVMDVINNDEDGMLVLGTKTKVGACVSPGDNNEIILINDISISLNSLLKIIDVYLQDLPTYPGESAHNEITNEIFDGEKIYKNGKVVNIVSEFNLYGVHFECQSFIENVGIYRRYIISVCPERYINFSE